MRTDRDYAQVASRATADERATMRAMMAEAHASYTETGEGVAGEDVSVVVTTQTGYDYDYSQYVGGRAGEMACMVMDSVFARFRAEGRYGEMSCTVDGRTYQRDTY